MLKILPQIALALWGIVPGNYSGITRVTDTQYAIVDDKDPVDGFKMLTLDIDSVSGKVLNASLSEPEGMLLRRANKQFTDADCEGIAYFDAHNTIFVTSEAQQRILEYDINGMPTGRELAIPPSMQKDMIVPNLGFEALTYNACTGMFWTTTESMLPADGELSSSRNPLTYNRLRFLCYDASLSVKATYVYEMDLPKAKGTKGQSVFGVPSLLALDDGRLLVMEREAYFPPKKYGSWVRINLYVVRPADNQCVALDTPMSEVSTEMCMKKELLCSFTTHLRLGKMNLSNYEGMCLGPRLADGRQTIILIADSQNGYGNRLFHLKDNIRVIIL